MSNSGIQDFQPGRLAAVRKEHGISQVEAAKRMHLSISGYNNFERGERTPSWQTVFIMALVLGTSVEYLTGETDDPRPTHSLIPLNDSKDIAELVFCCKKLTEKERAALTVIVKSIAEGRSEG